MALFQRDFRLAVRAGGGALTGLLFFMTVVAIVPFAVGPEPELLSRIGPAMLWIGALLSSLLGLDRMFQTDREDGSLDLMLMQEHPLVLTVLVKCAAHWAATGLPILAAAPFVGLMMSMNAIAIGATMVTLLLGSPALTFIGAVGAAVAVSLPRGGLLVSILILPLTIPVLIVGVDTVDAAANRPDAALSPLLIVTAITMFFAVIGPVGAALALRTSAD